MKHDVLIADDDDQLRSLLDMMLKDSFRLHFAENAKQALENIQQIRFQFILLDIHMPDQSGLDVCREINSMPEARRPPVVILSADSEDDIVKEAYELGVADYICKPFNVTALYERMLRLSRDLEKIATLKSRDDETKSMTDSVMKQAASYGNALDLISRLNHCHSAAELADTILRNLLNQDFHCAIQLRTDAEVISKDVDEEQCSDIELQVFNVLKDKGRVYNFGKRCIFNDEHVSILVKNMPIDGTISYDSFIDVAAKLVPAVNARFKALCEHQSLLHTQQQLNGALAMLSEGVQQMEVEKRQLMESIELQIGLSFHQLQLDEHQEAYFLELIEKEIRSREESNKLDKVQTMISECVSSLTIMKNDEPQQQESKASEKDIELF
ncbi:MAG: PleD family two-component system response regulator [Aestuariibacter sp.]